MSQWTLSALLLWFPWYEIGGSGLILCPGIDHHTGGDKIRS